VIAETRDILKDKAALATRVEVVDEDETGKDHGPNCSPASPRMWTCLT
jgi:hypothetical protein